MIQALLRAIVYGVGLEIGRDLYHAVKSSATRPTPRPQPVESTEGTDRLDEDEQPVVDDEVKGDDEGEGGEE